MYVQLRNVAFGDKRRVEKRYLSEKRGAFPSFSDGKFQYLCRPFQKLQKIGQLTSEQRYTIL